MHRHVLILVAGLSIGVASPAATEPAPSDRHEQVAVDYVLIDVIAVGRTGKPVTDLTRNDFVVTENKRRISLESFDVLDLLPAGAPAVSETPRASEGGDTPAGPPPVGPRGPRYLVALDLEFAGMAGVHRTFDQLETFLGGVPAGAGSWSLYSLDDGALTGGFVDGPGEAARALAAYRREYLDRLPAARSRSGAGRDRARGSRDLAQLEDRFEECRFAAKHSPQFAAGGFRECISGELDAFLDDLERRTARAIEELERLTARFPDRDRLNTVLLVSPGFSLHPGEAAIAMASIYLELGVPVTATSERRGPHAPLPLRRAASLEQEFRRVVHACVRDRVVFHTFDIHHYNAEASRRLDPSFAAAANRVARVHGDHAAELTQGLSVLARESGGRHHAGPRLGDLGTLLERTRYVYTLGYPSPPGDDRFRRIRVKCRRKGVRLSHRTGYFPRPD